MGRMHLWRHFLYISHTGYYYYWAASNSEYEAKEGQKEDELSQTDHGASRRSELSWFGRWVSRG